MSTGQLYIKAFNNGYLLNKYEPKLLQTVIKNLTPSNEYLEGLFAGNEEYGREIKQLKLSELEILRNNANERDSSFEKDL